MYVQIVVLLNDATFIVNKKIRSKYMDVGIMEYYFSFVLCITSDCDFTTVFNHALVT